MISPETKKKLDRFDQEHLKMIRQIIDFPGVDAADKIDGLGYLDDPDHSIEYHLKRKYPFVIDEGFRKLIIKLTTRVLSLRKARDNVPIKHVPT